MTPPSATQPAKPTELVQHFYEGTVKQVDMDKLELLILYEDGEVEWEPFPDKDITLIETDVQQKQRASGKGKGQYE